MNYLITGGTGTIGRELLRQLAPQIGKSRIVIFSRDEAKHADMLNEFSQQGITGLRSMVGDICDYERLVSAMQGIDVVIHAAAMKHIDKCEYNPTESMRVNVLGSINVARACIETAVSQCLFISTDKACNPVSAYGGQKYASERLFIGMNNMSRRTRFNIVRYGNVFGSRGSFIEKWLDLAKKNLPITITDEHMTRFFWTIQDAAAFVLDRITDGETNFDRGLIYIPKMRSFKMIDLANEISKENEIKITGMRCPEKIHEELVSETEGKNCYDQGNHYIIYPAMHEWAASITPRGKKCQSGFKLTSQGVIWKAEECCRA